MSTSKQPKRTLSAEEIKMVFEASHKSPSAEDSLTRRAEADLQEVASLLSHFTLDRFISEEQPEDDRAKARESAAMQLLNNSDRIQLRDGQFAWKLREGTRYKTIKNLVKQGKLEKRLNGISNRPDDAAQRTLEDYITGKAKPLEDQGLQQLFLTDQVTRWLRPAGISLPSEHEIKKRIDQVELIAPFHQLVGDHFRGRQNELRRLRSYVDVLPEESLGETIKRGSARLWRGLFNLREQPPLLIYGPGGVGKSTLISKFILDHATPESAFEGVAFCYLDLDRRSLQTEYPVTLLREAARQLVVQGFRAFERVNDQLQQSSLRRHEGYSKRFLSMYLELFREALHESDLEDRPLLFVLDTFEEAQYAAQEKEIYELFRFLDALQEAVPRLRTVIAGRAMIREFRVEPMRLEEFDTQSAIAVLESWGVPSKLAKSIGKKFHGSPLTLRLAADLATKQEGGFESLRDVKTQSIFFQELDQELIQGELYKRILGHIHDEEVAKLAHPGLVLRRITPDIIVEILAKPCQLQVTKLADAEALFKKLEREVALVQLDSDGSLRHQSDLRRVMIDLLNRDKPSLVREIHSAAVRYYKKLVDRGESEPAIKAELLYHSLAIEQGQDQIKQIWSPSLRPYLKNAIEELPPEQATILAKYLDVPLPESIARGAEDGEASITRISAEIERSLSRYQGQEALSLAHELERWPDRVELSILRARVFEQCLEWDQEQAVLEEAVSRARETQTNPEDFFSLLNRRVDVLRRLRSIEQAFVAAEELSKIGERLQNPALQFQATACRILVEAQAKEEVSPPSIEMLDKHFSDTLLGQDFRYRTHANLIRNVTAAVAPHSPHLLQRGMYHGAMGSPGLAETRLYAKAFSLLAEELQPYFDEHADSLPIPIGLLLNPGPQSAMAWENLIMDFKPRDLRDVIVYFLGFIDKCERSPRGVDSLINALRMPQPGERWAAITATLKSSRINDERTQMILHDCLGRDADMLLGRQGLKRHIKDNAIDIAIDAGVLEQFIDAVLLNNGSSLRNERMMSLLSLPEYRPYVRENKARHVIEVKENDNILRLAKNILQSDELLKNTGFRWLNDPNTDSEISIEITGDNIVVTAYPYLISLRTGELVSKAVIQAGQPPEFVFFPRRRENPPKFELSSDRLHTLMLFEPESETSIAFIIRKGLHNDEDMDQ